MHGVTDAPGPPAPRWRAPAAAGPVRARLRLPGSKSMTNRALVLAALAEEPTLIFGPLAARDSSLMVCALRALGAVVEEERAAPGDSAAGDSAAGDSATAADLDHAAPGPSAALAARDGDQVPAWRVFPPRRIPAPSAAGIATVDVGNAGTVLRFVPPVAALTRSTVEFRGDERAAQRPVRPLLAALAELGAIVESGGRGAVPFLVRGRGRVAGGTVTLDASESSQFVSGLLLSAPRYDSGAEVRHEGPPVPSAPHIAMTVQMLRAAGAHVETASGPRGESRRRRSVPDVWRVRPGELRPETVAVEPDLSNAGPFLAAALVTGGSVTVAGWPRQTAQPAAQILDVLAAMGGECTAGPGEMRVTGSGTIRGVTADLRDVSELVPVVTALAALADSPSRLRGIGHMRRHESDRLAALAAEIGALGGEVTELDDGLEIRPRPLRAGGTVFSSHNDHRLVMAAAVLGLAVPGLVVGNAATVAKTFPAFTGMWSSMLERSP